MARLGRGGDRNYFDVENAELFNIVFNDLPDRGFFLVSETTDDGSSRLNSFGKRGCFVCRVRSNHCDGYLSTRYVF